MMGPGIALTLALGGVRATLVSRTQEGIARGLSEAAKALDLLVAHDLAPNRDALSLLDGSTDSDAAVRAADLVIESAPEKLSLKQEMFEHWDSITGPETVLASNTSGLSITAIAADCRHPERVVTTHFWNPPHLVPLVEIVKGEKTDAQVAESLRDLFTACGKVPVIVHKDRPGQLGNRLQMALLREAGHMIGEGIASAEDIDLVLKNGLGLRYPAYSLLEHQDIVGLDLALAVCEYVSADLNSDRQAPAALRNLVKEGKLGARSGQGFLHWGEGEAEALKARRDRFLVNFLRSKKLGL